MKNIKIFHIAGYSFLKIVNIPTCYSFENKKALYKAFLYLKKGFKSGDFFVLQNQVFDNGTEFQQYIFSSFGYLIKKGERVTAKELAKRIKLIYDTANPKTAQVYEYLSQCKFLILRSFYDTFEKTTEPTPPQVRKSI